MKLIDADELKSRFPGRRSLEFALDNAKKLTVQDVIEDVKTEMCDKYCKIPFQYSKKEWEQMIEDCDDNLPCHKCPLNRL